MLIDKPPGPTSHDVVRQVRRCCRTRAVGHTGTLDPFASGLLVVLIGRGTRLARFVERQDKRYLAQARLGVTTDTEDLTGRVMAETALPDSLTADAVARQLAGFVGCYRQVPPQYSAKKVAGVASHRLARRGAAPQLSPVEVAVHAVELLDLASGVATFRATVGAGTYLRSLARDLGERLGVGAHLVSLRREAIGRLQVDQAMSLADLAPGVELRPLIEVLSHLPAVELTAEQRSLVSHGRPVAGAAPAGAEVVLTSGGEVVAVAEGTGGDLQPRVVLAG